MSHETEVTYQPQVPEKSGPRQVNEKLMVWASDLDDATIRQAERTARLPFVPSHVALMPDAHIGIGATVGSVIPTIGAIIPAAVGVDIGCGMIATELDLRAEDLPDDLSPLLSMIERSVPSGVGRGHEIGTHRGSQWLKKHEPRTRLDNSEQKKALQQFGTLGSGNHFLEVCLDERDRVWVVVHSGSRGMGNILATRHINAAKRLAKDLFQRLEDPALASFVEGTPEFETYIADMLWSQDYALMNREQMMDRTLREVFTFVGAGRETKRINCHHNFTQRETHVVGGVEREMWITRKGAIKAGTSDLGVIPGSMGTRSYIVRGKGSADSWCSCSHGAGRRYSRTEAKRRFTERDLTEQMAGKVWLEGKASALLDEIPSAYKDIDQVMADQADLVEVLHTLRQIVNYKGA